MSSFFNKIIALSVIRYLTKPWQELSAYREGIIDDKGTLLIKPRDMTIDQRRVYGPIQRIAFEIRKVIDMVPAGRKLLGTTAGLMALLREEMLNMEYSEDSFDLVEEAMFHHLSEKFDLSDCPSHEAVTLPPGTYGDIELSEGLEPETVILGVPVYRLQEELVSLDDLPQVLRENMTTGAVDMGSGGGEKFGGIQVFSVTPEEYQKCIKGKHPRHRYSKYTENASVREYGRKSKPGTPIIVKDSRSGSMVYLKK